MHIKITEKMHQELKNHLHCGDGLEALAFALCGRHQNRNDDMLLVHELHLISYDKCERTENTVSWKTIDLEKLLEKALKFGFGIVKFHSHFIQDSDFSSLDDTSDNSFFDSVYGWVNDENPHASVVMYPNGSMKGRVINYNLDFSWVDKITVIGDNVTIFPYTKTSNINNAFKRNSQAFGQKTVNNLNNMKIGVIGCSGTGSPLIEMLYRLGTGKLVLVDSDVMGTENLNRIISSKLSDAQSKKLKVDVIKNHIEEVNIGTEVFTYSCLLQENQKAIDELASCDFLFGCMDSVEGRYYANLISTYYIVPLIDIGVKLVADGEGGIDSIIGNIHYTYSGSATLLERGVFSINQLTAESLKRVSKEEYENRQVYFDNADVESPAVISVNSLCSSLAVNDMLARIHPYRYLNNSKYSHTVINLTEWDINSYIVGNTKEKSHLNNIGIGNQNKTLKVYDSEKVN